MVSNKSLQNKDTAQLILSLLLKIIISSIQKKILLEVDVSHLRVNVNYSIN